MMARTKVKLAAVVAVGLLVAGGAGITGVGGTGVAATDKSPATMSGLRSDAKGDSPLVAELERAKTLHITGSRFTNGEWVKEMEIFYDRNAGVYEWEQRGDRVTVRIDDGRREWRYNSQANSVRRGMSTDTLGIARQLLTASGHEESLKRDAAGDRVIDGKACEHYIGEGAGGKMRVQRWLDPDKRLRRHEREVLSDGKWQADRLILVEWGVAVDPKVFTPDFGSKVRLMEAEKLEQTMREEFSVDKAMWKTEVMGLILAVHKVERAEDGWIYVVTSVRPTEQTLKLWQVPRDNRSGVSHPCGEHELRSSFQRDATDPNRMRDYSIQPLATVQHQGMEIKWTALKPVGEWPDGYQKYDLNCTIRASDSGWMELRRSRGDASQQEVKPTPLPVTVRKGALAQIVADAYEQAERLEGLELAELELMSQPFTDAEMEEMYQKGTIPRSHTDRMYHVRTTAPSKISLNDYQREIEQSVQRARELER